MTHTLIAELAAYFTRRPNVWIDGRELARVGGVYAWRSRISDLRRYPWCFRIDNRLRRVTTDAGDDVVVSEYRLVVVGQQLLPLAPARSDTPRGDER